MWSKPGAMAFLSTSRLWRTSCGFLSSVKMLSTHSGHPKCSSSPATICGKCTLSHRRSHGISRTLDQDHCNLLKSYWVPTTWMPGTVIVCRFHATCWKWLETSLNLVFAQKETKRNKLITTVVYVNFVYTHSNAPNGLHGCRGSS
jgi:hypothetical protein